METRPEMFSEPEPGKRATNSGCETKRATPSGNNNQLSSNGRAGRRAGDPGSNDPIAPKKSDAKAPESSPSSGRGRSSGAAAKRQGDRRTDTRVKATEAARPTLNLKKLEAEIRKYHDKCFQSFRTSLEHARRVGKALIEVKEGLHHGKFTKWVEDRKIFSIETARVYMRIARSESELELGSLSNQHSTAGLTIVKALASLSKPRAATGVKKGPKTDGGDNTDTHSQPTHSAEDPTSPDTETRAGSSRDPGEAGGGDRGGGADDQPDRRVAYSGGAEERTDAWLAQDRTVPDPEDQLSDEQWLASLQIRSRLNDIAVFDEEALTWRRARPVVVKLLSLHAPTPEDITEAKIGTNVKRRVTLMIALLSAVMHPRDWTLCNWCEGGPTDVSSKIPCAHCKGAGFEIRLEADTSPADHAEE
jgi:hypothetical protein